MTSSFRNANPRKSQELATRRRAICLVCKETVEIPGEGVCYDCNRK